MGALFFTQLSFIPVVEDRLGWVAAGGGYAHGHASRGLHTGFAIIFVLLSALLLPLLPAMVLYGSYKSLCFGLLLLGLVRLDWTLPSGNVNQAASHDSPQARPWITSLIVNRVYPPMRGATGRLLHDLARHFVKTGYRVTILTTTTGKPGISARGPIGIILSGVDKPNKRDWLRACRISIAPYWQTRVTIWLITLSDPPLLYAVGQRAAKKKGCAHIHWCRIYIRIWLRRLASTYPRGF